MLPTKSQFDFESRLRRVSPPNQITNMSHNNAKQEYQNHLTTDGISELLSSNSDTALRG